MAAIQEQAGPTSPTSTRSVERKRGMYWKLSRTVLWTVSIWLSKKRRRALQGSNTATLEKKSYLYCCGLKRVSERRLYRTWPRV